MENYKEHGHLVEAARTRFTLMIGVSVAAPPLMYKLDEIEFGFVS